VREEGDGESAKLSRRLVLGKSNGRSSGIGVRGEEKGEGLMLQCGEDG
jgi:hypothetical protein